MRINSPKRSFASASLLPEVEMSSAGVYARQVEFDLAHMGESIAYAALPCPVGSASESDRLEDALVQPEKLRRESHETL